MKTNAKQFAKLIGTTSLMVLGILFLTVLPLNTIEAGNFEKSDCNSMLASNIALEPWMLSIEDWNTNRSVVENNAEVNIESWMLTPEFWDNALETEFAAKSASDINALDIWMLQPEGWNCDIAMIN